MIICNKKTFLLMETTKAAALSFYVGLGMLKIGLAGILFGCRISGSILMYTSGEN